MHDGYWWLGCYFVSVLCHFFGHIPLVAPATGACLTRLRRICSWQRATCTCCTTRRRMHTAQPHVMTLCDESDATLDLMDDLGTSLAPTWRKVMEPVKIRKANETEQKATQVLFHQSSAVATGDLTTSCNHPIPIHPISLAVLDPCAESGCRHGQRHRHGKHHRTDGFRHKLLWFRHRQPRRLGKKNPRWNTLGGTWLWKMVRLYWLKDVFFFLNIYIYNIIYIYTSYIWKMLQYFDSWWFQDLVYTNGTPTPFHTHIYPGLQRASLIRLTEILSLTMVGPLVFPWHYLLSRNIVVHDSCAAVYWVEELT